MSGSCYLCDFLEQLHIFRLWPKLIIPHECREGCSTENAKLLFIHLLEERALVEFRSALQVAKQFRFLYVEDLDLQPFASFTLIKQIFQTSPTAFELLEVGMVHDLIELSRHKLVNLRDARIDRRLCIFGDSCCTLQNFLHKSLDEVFAAFAGRFIVSEAPFFDDPVQQTRLINCLCCRRCGLRCLSHCCLHCCPCPGPALRLICRASRCWKRHPAEPRRASRYPASSPEGPPVCGADPAVPLADLPGLRPVPAQNLLAHGNLN